MRKPVKLAGLNSDDAAWIGGASPQAWLTRDARGRAIDSGSGTGVTWLGDRVTWPGSGPKRHRSPILKNQEPVIEIHMGLVSNGV